VTPHPIDFPDIWLSEKAWRSVSRRFDCASGLSPSWPKPDLVSVCTSPGFVEDQLCQELLARTGESAERRWTGQSRQPA
jgi:hypothetical protein